MSDIKLSKLQKEVLTLTRKCKGITTEELYIRGIPINVLDALIRKGLLYKSSLTVYKLTVLGSKYE